MKTKYSNEAIHRNYQRMEILWKNDTTNLDQISLLTRLFKRVVQQYADLLPDKSRKYFSKNKILSLSANQNILLSYAETKRALWGAARQGITRLLYIRKGMTTFMAVIPFF